MPKEIIELAKNIGIKIKNPSLFQQAFIHRSYLNECRQKNLQHNERLEFLGDAVLEFLTTEYLYKNYPNPEGEMTNWRAALVRGRMLSQIAEDLNLSEFLYLSKGEQKNFPNSKNYILANTLEALIGVLYLDQGIEKTRRLVEKWILNRIEEILVKKLYVDPKTNFQELIQEKEGVTPIYKVLSEDGPDHAKEFEVGVFVNEKLAGTGRGPSKQAAEQGAAKAALEKNCVGVISLPLPVGKSPIK